ncbi:haloacid dehalogenase [Penicillium taxi]|uniref:haloacid dehalogenase n=1 Tax=Penicillium taxi TaxID=168475 RepID=UPI0025454AB2|nr:haloacid dehalogenase [Penicillium taxi]KAJ5902874.1 haloacid dehalogenase [Penicillium taxi]
MTQTPKIKAVFFDFMGTCLDWHTSIVNSSPSFCLKDDASNIALEWRRIFFIEIQTRFRQSLDPEDIDVTLARALDIALEKFPDYQSSFHPDAKKQMIEAWHSQSAWPDVQKAIETLRGDLDLEVFVLANGTTRLQLDLVRSSGLSFNMLFSSELLGLYKPHQEVYKKALQLVKLKPEEVVMVAAHAYDLRGAQGCGLKTIYIHRWTDDVDEDMEKVKSEFNAFLEYMVDLPFVIEHL